MGERWGPAATRALDAQMELSQSRSLVAYCSATPSSSSSSSLSSSPPPVAAARLPAAAPPPPIALF
eukprot:3347461-Pyramimonas_sp.AAC.1